MNEWVQALKSMAIFITKTETTRHQRASLRKDTILPMKSSCPSKNKINLNLTRLLEETCCLQDTGRTEGCVKLCHSSKEQSARKSTTPIMSVSNKPSVRKRRWRDTHRLKVTAVIHQPHQPIALQRPLNPDSNSILKIACV